jgi:serine/threonine-protein kinase RsbW
MRSRRQDEAMTIPAEFGVAEADLTELVVANDLRQAREPEQRIMDELVDKGYDPDTVFAVKLALEEALTNAVKHGNCGDPDKHVRIRYVVEPARVVLMVADEGCGFCPDDVPDPTLAENLERPSGRGIMLMQSYMTKVRFNEVGNEVWLLKERQEN